MYVMIVSLCWDIGVPVELHCTTLRAGQELADFFSLVRHGRASAVHNTITRCPSRPCHPTPLPPDQCKFDDFVAPSTYSFRSSFRISSKFLASSSISYFTTQHNISLSLFFATQHNATNPIVLLWVDTIALVIYTNSHTPQQIGSDRIASNYHIAS